MGIKDRGNTILAPVFFIRLSLQVHFKVLVEHIRAKGLKAMLNVQEIRDVASARFFIMTSAGFINYENTTSVPSLVHSASGRILEIGPGAGNQIHRYDASAVEILYAADPNPRYIDHIASRLKEIGLGDRYKLLHCGVEDDDVLSREGIVEGSMDTIVSIQVLCSVEDVERVMRQVWRLLKPGGRFIFWEHVRNHDQIAAVTQVCWEPAWSALIGCHLTRDIKADILAVGGWENPEGIEEVEEPYNVLPRIWGTLVKKA